MKMIRQKKKKKEVSLEELQQMMEDMKVDPMWSESDKQADDEVARIIAPTKGNERKRKRLVDFFCKLRF